MPSNLIKFLKFWRIIREVKFELNLRNRQAADFTPQTSPKVRL